MSEELLKAAKEMLAILEKLDTMNEHLLGAILDEEDKCEWADWSDAIHRAEN